MHKNIIPPIYSTVLKKIRRTSSTSRSRVSAEFDYGSALPPGSSPPISLDSYPFFHPNSYSTLFLSAFLNHVYFTLLFPRSFATMRFSPSSLPCNSCSSTSTSQWKTSIWEGTPLRILPAGSHHRY